MDQPLRRRVRLSADVGSPAVARRIVRSALRDAALDELADDALLLTSELCENAVLHAGTAFELLITAAGGELTVAVTDHGSTAMELRRGAPSDRRATHNRGLHLVDVLSTAWGSRHDHRGHQVWFTLRPPDHGPPPPDTEPAVPAPATWPDVDTCRWLLHIPARSVAVLPLPALITELLRRLCEVLDVDGGGVVLDHGDGEREQISYGRPPGPGAITVPLPLAGPRTGQLHVRTPAGPADRTGIVELLAQRIALAVETDRIRGADHERWTWMTYLAEASDLLIQSLDLEHATAIVPQIIVPRLGPWCAVHLLDEAGELRLRAVTHVDEAAITRLKADLDRARLAEPGATWRRLLAGDADTAGLGPPTPGLAVPLRARRLPLGILSIGHPADRPHGPDEVLMATELARRAAHAIDNAQRNATTVATSQALQQALLPRALPSGTGICFAAAYRPATTGADVGGDFYDVVAIDDDRWLAAVGDVCGTGPRAAARTGMVRDVLRVLIREGNPVVRAIELLHQTLLDNRDPRQFATVAVALISRQPADPATLTVELVLAGHEQPVLLRADGAATLIGRHGTALGLTNDFTVHPTRHTLGSGDSLVFYTDGVTERRRGTDQFGHERLTSTLAATAGGPADQTLDAVLRAVYDFSPQSQQDDIVILVAHAPRTGSSTAAVL